MALALGAASVCVAAPSLQVRGDGACPSAEQVSAALDYLLKGAGGTAETATDALTLVVADLGPRYQVSLAGQVRAYEDLARDCDERARVAAVFAAITMEPPEVAERAKPPAPLPAPRRRLELNLGGLVEVGIERSQQVVSSGGELRGALVGQRWGIEIGAGAEAPGTLAWGAYRAKITRFPLDIGIRTILRRPPVALSVSAGLAAALFHLSGEGAGLTVRDGGTRLDLGVRSAVSLVLLPAGRWSPFLSLHVSLSPKPYAVTVDPVGQVGSTPQVWVGATLGIAVAAR